MSKWLKLYAIYTFSIYPDLCHYTIWLKADVLNFYLTLDLLRSDCSDVEVKRAYCRDNFLAQRPLPDMRRSSGDGFLCFNRMESRRISTRYRRFPEARERCEKRVVV